MAKTFEQIFALVDRFSAPLLKMEEKMRSAGRTGDIMNRHLRPHEKLFLHINQDVEQFSRKIREASQTTREFGGRISGILAPLAAFGAVGSIGGLVEMVHGFAETSEQLGLASQKIGITVGQFQQLGYAAKITGIDTESMQTSLEHLNKNLGAAATGHGKEVAALLTHLHISLRGSNGQILSAAQALPQLANAFAHTKDPALQALMATTLFGRAGIAMLPLLDKGSAGLAALTAQFNKYGYALSGKDVDAGNKFNDSWKNMQTAIGGLTDDISAKLAPVLTPIIQQIADWTAKNRDWIATRFASTLQSVGDTLSKINFSQVLTDMGSFLTKVGNIIDDLGGLKTVLLVTGGVMTASFLAPLVTTTAQILKLATVMGTTMITSILGFTRDLIVMLPLMTSFRNVMAALDVVIDANPIGAAIIAFTALAAIGLVLYDNWKPIKKFFEGIGNDIDKANTSIEHFLGVSGGISATPGPGRVRTRFGYLDVPSQSVAPAGAAQVIVHFSNAPPGTTATVMSSPGSPKVRHNLGRSRMSE